MSGELEKALTHGQVPAVVLLYGNEPGPLRAAIEAIRAAVLTPGLEAFNHERFSGRELEAVGPVLEACGQLPLMAARRLVELDDPDAVGKGRAASEVAKTSVDALVSYIADPNPSTVLLLVGAELDGRSKLVNAAKKRGIVVKFEPLKGDRDAALFVREQAQAGGFEIKADAVQALVAAAGTRMSELMAALERASLHAGPGRAITRADVEAVAGHAREAVIFELTDAVGMGRREEALGVLARMFHESGESEIGQTTMTLTMLVRQLRLVFLAKGVGGSVGEIQALAGVPPFVARKLAEQARNFDEARLRRAFAGLARLDLDLKGGAPSVVRGPFMALQRWILDACGALPETAPRV